MIFLLLLLLLFLFFPNFVFGIRMQLMNFFYKDGDLLIIKMDMLLSVNMHIYIYRLLPIKTCMTAKLQSDNSMGSAASGGKFLSRHLSLLISWIDDEL